MDECLTARNLELSPLFGSFSVVKLTVELQGAQWGLSSKLRGHVGEYRRQAPAARARLL